MLHRGRVHHAGIVQPQQALLGTVFDDGAPIGAAAHQHPAALHARAAHHGGQFCQGEFKVHAASCAVVVSNHMWMFPVPRAFS